MTFFRRNLFYFLFSSCFVNSVVLFTMYKRSNSVINQAIQQLKQDTKNISLIEKIVQNNYDSIQVFKDILSPSSSSFDQDLRQRFTQKNGLQNQYFLNLLAQINAHSKDVSSMAGIRQPDSLELTELLLGTWYTCSTKTFSSDYSCPPNEWRYSFFRGGICKMYGPQTSTYGNFLPGRWRLEKNNHLYIVGEDNVQAVEMTNNYELKLVNDNKFYSIDIDTANSQGGPSVPIYVFFQRQIGFRDKPFK